MMGLKQKWIRIIVVINPYMRVKPNSSVFYLQEFGHLQSEKVLGWLDKIAQTQQ